MSEPCRGQTVRIRPIRPADDAAIAAIIRAVMTEWGASGPGFAIHDAEVDAMSAAYAAPRALYLVAEAAGRLLGGAGIGPLAGGDRETCELRKMYLLPEGRGRGLGRALLARCLEAAREFGYRRCYLETLGTMWRAERLYREFGFRPLPGPIGQTGHFGCDRFYLLELRREEA
ncbi:MAG: GNAT family N-acetyltransferase [Xanthomonadales bacterium]|nr:GNAT family N-acetyltransferase [Xanthomonadales bacterium]